jgi:hypothetical protein
MGSGILGQFNGARDSLYSLNLLFCPAYDWLGLCFEVPETTGNSTDDTQDGGFYFLEGFPFQTCHQQKLLNGHARIGVRIH